MILIKTHKDIPYNEMDKSETCFRMTHDGKKVTSMSLVEETGITATVFTLFTGSEQECIAETTKLTLDNKL